MGSHGSLQRRGGCDETCEDTLWLLGSAGQVGAGGLGAGDASWE